MSKQIDTGGEAFPSGIACGPAGDIESSVSYGYGGMSLRDYFAGQVLAGIFASSAPESIEQSRVIAAACYMQADAMLAERTKDV